jgi:hypothetical protein
MIDRGQRSSLHSGVRVIANRQKEEKTDTVLADAVDRLLRATKERMLRENGRIDYEKLAREGFSTALTQRLKML